MAARRRARPSRRDSTAGTASSGHEAPHEVPGVVVYRWEAPLFFANAGAFRRQIRHLVRERKPAWVVVQCEAITDVDVTAAGMLEQLDEELNAAGVHMAFVEMRSRLQNLVQQYGLFETLDRDHFYPSVETALAAIDRGGTVSDTRVPISPRRRLAAVVGPRRHRWRSPRSWSAILFRNGASLAIGLVGLVRGRGRRVVARSPSGCRAARSAIVGVAVGLP